MTASIHDALSTVLNELLDGSASDSGWVLNPQDPRVVALARQSLCCGCLGDSGRRPFLDRRSCRPSPLWPQSSQPLEPGEENPFADADWSASWKRTTVSESEWSSLRNDLQSEARKWQSAVRQPREFTDDELKGYLASAAHLAYHLGAIRQMNAAARGPCRKVRRCNIHCLWI